ncbi:MAG: amidohydrolase family protein, partial [Rhodospirillaceae bacterium]|nr:amidohydrolase family protein [Rhodospirillaceae bacterium]
LRLHHSGDLSLPALFRAMSLNPARRLGLDCGRLSADAPADLVLFDPDVPFVLDRFKLKSKSKNSPFDNQLLQGRILRTFVAGEEIYRSCA